ncbi:16S rRNA (cytosine(967)-C(5))-methyltransferase RsmB [Streptococcus sp. CSL10205-OR2]|uniref:16S rRNA (cytosine(967)-C(5))-methyltransferase RsmB n=1 Tax=Streptococcus sp. CSL10205-OR2 TaxID=2980558 RepID=UPI0021DB415C|nr:16S rRNA (cytosine(967)-C(5))-methyltransferase RsmB [Streptococcus sp. CSL10205-OR2]MCU9533492.1 16S rRNA (cytosine(967)-C(5))-methyltransferase RsmB [Streptococcus sp. CSL10205-OR2]
MVSKWKKMPRGKALEMLTAIFEEGAYSNILLNQNLEKSQLGDKDKALITEIVYGTVSRKITLEWYLSHFIEDRDKLEPWLYHLLMMSLYQIIYLDKIPDHAVVNDAVVIAKDRGKNRGKEKLVNAVLRQFLRTKRPDYKTIKRINKRYSIQYSVPVWLVKKMIAQYGEQRALAIFESLFVRNKTSFRVTNPEKITEIADVLEASSSLLSPVGLVKSSGNVTRTDYFRNGEITIQDESSQLVAPTLKIKGDETILDACSAPGGKTVHMATYLTSGQITALDIYEHKLELVRENANRMNVSDKINTQQLDATTVHKHFPKDSFDKILVDAPCSGIGLIRRKPEIKYQKKEQDLVDLQKIQLQILASVCQTLRKGGIITYSTCTLFEEENNQVISQFLETHPNFKQVALTHPLKDITKNGFISITPEQYHTDGFFIGQIKRIS